MLLKKYDEHDSEQDKQIVFWKDSFYGMVCYAILCYGMVLKVWYAMRFQCYAMRFLCYAIVYVVKDKHSVTVQI